MFRRRHRDAGDVSLEQPAGELAGEAQTPASQSESPPPPPPKYRPNGPWDVTEVADDIERLDFGGLRVPGVPGMAIRLELSGERVVAVTVIDGLSALQLQPFAAPRTLGIWDEIRKEISAEVAHQGGSADEADGLFGTELHAHVPAQTPDSPRGVQPARFVGVDGPRWFLRGVFTGHAVSDPRAAATLEEVLQAVVVVRGSDAMAPREPIELRLPEEAQETDPAGGPPDEADSGTDHGRHADLNPFQRGPEITEVR